VGCVADESPRERYAGDIGLRLGCPSERRPQRREQLGAGGGSRPALVADREPRAVEPHFQRVAETDERVTRQPLAALDALEQKARTERRELHERRHRRVEITGYVEGWLQRCGTPNVDRDNKTPIPGSSGDGFLAP